MPILVQEATLSVPTCNRGCTGIKRDDGHTVLKHDRIHPILSAKVGISHGNTVNGRVLLLLLLRRRIGDGCRGYIIVLVVVVVVVIPSYSIIHQKEHFLGFIPGVMRTNMETRDTGQPSGLIWATVTCGLETDGIGTLGYHGKRLGMNSRAATAL